MDLTDERIWKGTELVSLRRKPFAILRHLVTHPARLVTHEELLAAVWGGAVVSESALRSHLHELRRVLGDGVIETVVGRGYRFVATLVTDDAPSPPDPTVPAIDRNVVGRQPELAILEAALARARTGHRQLCFVLGEPGIGKTTLVDTFLATLAASDTRAVVGHCIEQYGTPEPYLALIEVIGRLRQSDRGEQALAALVRYAPSFLAQVPHLIPDPQLDDVLRRARATGGEARMTRELVEAIEVICMHQPLVLVLEDVQWSDVATIDLISLLGQRKERANLMVIVTSRRAEAQTVTHPLNLAMRNLVARAGAISIPLDRIAQGDIRDFLELRFPNHAFGDSFFEILDRITAGTPLFLVSFVEDLVSRGMMVQRDGRWMLEQSSEDIAAYRPATVRQLIDIQLDRLTPDEQRVLETASLIGPEFSTRLVAAALELSIEHVDDVCDGLVRRALFLQRDDDEVWPDGQVVTRYRMSHALVKEVCFERCAVSRRQRLHRAIAEHLEVAYGERAAEIAHLIATHFDNGQMVARALHHYVVAGDRTALRFSTADASRLYRRGLALLPRAPATPERDALELRILVGISQSVVLSSDSDSHEPVALFDRAIAIARSLGDLPQLHATLVNRYFRHSTLAQYREADAIDGEIMALERTGAISSTQQVFATCARGIAAMWKGELGEARRLLTSLTDHDAVMSGPIGGMLGATNRGAFMLIYLASVRWLVGEPEGAVEDALRAIAQATRTGDPYTLGAANTVLARVRYWRRDAPEQIRAAAEPVLAVSEAEVWHAQAAILAGVARSQQGPLEADEVDRLVHLFRTRSATFPMGATALGLPIVEILRRAGDASRAAALVDELRAFAHDHDEHMLAAEYARLRGELLEPSDAEAAEAAYLDAVETAHRQSARALELRAAIRLATVARTGASREAARSLLARAVSAFAAGTDSAEVAEARRLLS